MADFLAKPYRSADLAAVLERWLPAALRVATPAVEAAGPREPAAAAEREAVFDPAALAALSVQHCGGEAIVAQVVELFLVEGRRQIDTLREAWLRRDLDTAARAAHTLKASAATLGAMRLSARCNNIETAMRAGLEEGIEAWINEADSAFTAACAEMNGALAPGDSGHA